MNRSDLWQLIESGQDAKPKDIYAISYRTANMSAAVKHDSRPGSDHFMFMSKAYPSEFGRPDLGSDKPEWDGSRMPGKTLLVHGVKLMGMGDWFNFAPLVNEAKKQGGFDEVVIELPKRLMPVFQSQGLADQLVAKGEPLPAHDATVSLMSLPSLTATNLQAMQAPAGYLAPEWEIGDTQRDWIDRNIRAHQQRGEKAVALWHSGDAGNFALEMPKVGRSLDDVATLGPLFDLPGHRFIVMQDPKDLKAGTRLGEQYNALSASQRSRITYLPEDFDAKIAFGDTGHAMRACDYGIGTDTGLLHAFGAMRGGSPDSGHLIIMGQSNPELRLPSASNGRRSWRGPAAMQEYPFYDKATVVSQPKPGDWDSVVTTIRNVALEAQQSGKALHAPHRDAPRPV